MEEKIKAFLLSIGFYPLSKENWIVFTINHSKAETDEEKNKTLNYLKIHVNKINGIYIYKKVNGEVMYIGKGKPIYNRLKSHYYEIFKNPEYPCHHFTAFFSSNQGEVEIYCKELEDEDNRVIVETMLQKIYKPIFLGKKSTIT